MFFRCQYPEGLREYEYIPDFAVRGLHYDVQKVRCFCLVVLVRPHVAYGVNTKQVHEICL